MFLVAEIIAPQRPPAPPTEYFQLNIGGYDSETLLKVSAATYLPGYVGCMRGLKVGDHILNFASMVENNTEGK